MTDRNLHVYTHQISHLRLRTKRCEMKHRREVSAEMGSLPFFVEILTCANNEGGILEPVTRDETGPGTKSQGILFAVSVARAPRHAASNSKPYRLSTPRASNEGINPKMLQAITQIPFDRTGSSCRCHELQHVVEQVRSIVFHLH